MNCGIVKHQILYEQILTILQHIQYVYADVESFVSDCGFFNVP